jgi:zinc D-Ala-D-Ala dipeptidase
LLIADAVVSMRYASADNFVGRAVYPVNRCLLRRRVANKLATAALELRQQHRRVLLWDCYRPASIQTEFWRLQPDPRYVAKPVFAADGTPRFGSRHSRGAAVDIGLADDHGQALAMPTAHDEFSSRAHRTAALRSAAAGEFKVLDHAMRAAGFLGIATEWWHFDENGADQFQMSDVALEPLEP